MDIEKLLNVPCTFQMRPLYLPADIRIAWRIGIVLLSIKKCCWGEKASFAQLHVLNWSILSRKNRDVIRKILKKEMPPHEALVRIDPTLNLAVDYAIGENLIAHKEKRYALTSSGENLTAAICLDRDIFVIEKQYMEEIGKKLTQAFVNQIFAK